VPSATSALFGPAAAVYESIVDSIIATAQNVEYRFLDNEPVLHAVDEGKIGAREINQIVADELLSSAHLAAVSSVIRAQRWFDATSREYKSDNFVGWAACCRGLLEAIGDTAHSLGRTAHNLALNIRLFRSALAGLEDGIIRPQELEDDLIHFSHARKLSKHERSTEPPAHNALHTVTYIEHLGKTGIQGAGSLYSELCQVGHPARGSLSYLYAPNSDGAFHIDAARDGRAIREVIERYRPVFRDLPSVAFNPGLLILRVLVKFKRFPVHQELKRFDYQGAKAWKVIEPLLND
jgi:hypothetical protein